MDGKGKGRPSVRPMWLVAREDSVTAALATAGALHIFSNEIKAPSAVARDMLKIGDGRIFAGAGISTLHHADCIFALAR